MRSLRLTPLCRRGLRVIAASLILSLVGCTQPYHERFGELRAGMTQAEVESLLGRPSSQWTIAPPRDAATQRWQYGDNLSSLATSGVFGDADEERVHVVWFDAEGRVIAWSAPTWANEGMSNRSADHQ